MAVGTAIGEGLVKCMQDAGKTSGHVALLNGSPTDNNATLFKQGYEKAITGAGYTVAEDQSVPGLGQHEGRHDLRADVHEGQRRLRRRRGGQ